MSRQVKDVLLEKYLADAMTPEARVALEKTLAASPDDAARLAELRADSQAFLIQHPPAPFAARVLEKTERPRRAFWQWLVPVGALVAALLVLLVRSPRVEPETSIKGALGLTVHRQLQSGSETLTPEATLHPGDSLRFELSAARPGFVAVFGRDASGHVVAFTPQEGTQALKQLLARELLPDAIQLDDAGASEAFFAVWAPESFDVQRVARAIDEGTPVESVVPGAVQTAAQWPKTP